MKKLKKKISTLHTDKSVCKPVLYTDFDCM